MTKDQIIAEIDKITKLNKENKVDINDRLSRIRGVIDRDLRDEEDCAEVDTDALEKAAYERGLNDAWELARKVFNTSKGGGFSVDDMYDMFGTASRIIIFHDYVTGELVMEKYNDWLKKKEEEAKIIVRGDVVKVSSSGVIEEGIFIGYAMSGDAWVVFKNFNVPQHVCANDIVCKTGKHIDLDCLEG